jgi:hypothetical protein
MIRHLANVTTESCASAVPGAGGLSRRCVMDRIWRLAVRILIVAVASASLVLAPGVAAAQQSQTSGTAQTTQGSSEPAKSGGNTTQGAGEVGDRLQNSAKSFGEAILDGLKYAGRTVVGFFQGEKPQK